MAWPGQQSPGQRGISGELIWFYFYSFAASPRPHPIFRFVSFLFARTSAETFLREPRAYPPSDPENSQPRQPSVQQQWQMNSRRSEHKIIITKRLSLCKMAPGTIQIQTWVLSTATNAEYNENATSMLRIVDCEFAKGIVQTAKIIIMENYFKFEWEHWSE